ncbi:MAG: ATP-binding protein [Bacteroidales bacterium]
MQQNIKIPLLRAMGQIFDKSGESSMGDHLFAELEQELQLVAGYFEVNTLQAFLLSHIFVLNYNHSSANINRITRHLNCNPMRLLEHSGELEYLVKSGIVRGDVSGRRRSHTLSDAELYISPKIEEAILQDLPMPRPESPVLDCFVTLLERIVELEEELSESEISPGAFEKRLEELLLKNTHFGLIDQMAKIKMEKLDSFVFLRLVWEVLNGLHSVEVEKVIREVLSRKAGRRVKYLQSFLKETNMLQTLGWVNLRQSRFLNEAEIELTDKGSRLVTDMGLHLEKKQEKNTNYLGPRSIAAKELYFNAREAEELEMLQSMLMEKNFKKLQSRLKKQALPHGLTVLFFGYPGTGKTESVMQMARKSNREVYKVDISQTKSMWFGESEKIIKRIFSDYRNYAAECSRMPILLFNEADAIISKRKDASSSNVAQTENAIQNIILEELENFQGIFMATTNLVENLDKAFERRFLFKVEFDKPSAGVKAQIWQSKMPGLLPEQCAGLAAGFDFTGGQIDNIVRKCVTHSVLYGTPADMESITKFCRSENFHQSPLGAIGFKNRAVKKE